jgi:putative N6-adenine-specific DNA methylase
MKDMMQLFAVTAPGLEGVCAAELQRLRFESVVPEGGGVAFVGGLRELYLANLWLRSSTRVLVRIGEVRAKAFPELYQRALRLPWGRYVRPGNPLCVRASSHTSRLVHSGRIAETLVAAVSHALGTLATSSSDGQLLIARFVDDRCQLSIDSSGDLLHRRGYREEGGVAPLRETLAAGILLRLGWQGAVPLADPLCGSGTFLVEGALLAAGLPPGGRRNFAFMNWPGYRPGLWQVLLSEAGRAVHQETVALYGSDRDREIIAAAGRNAVRAGVESRIDFTAANLAELPPRRGPGLVVVNPPYGGRIGTASALSGVFARLGHDLLRAFPGWQIALLAPEERLARATRLPLHPLAGLQNGGLAVGLYATSGT